MDENVITLSSSDEESECLNQSKSKQSSSTAINLPLSERNAPSKVSYKTGGSRIKIPQCLVTVRNKPIQLKLPVLKLHRTDIVSAKKPEVVDLVDCYDKSSDVVLNGSSVLPDLKSSLVANKNNHSEQEIIEIDARTVNDNQPTEVNEEDKRTENENNSGIDNSVVNKFQISQVTCNSSQISEINNLKNVESSKNELNKHLASKSYIQSLNLFNEFVNYCSSFEDILNDRARLAQKLMKRFSETDPKYIKSDEFRELVQKFRNSLKKNNVYLIAKEMADELSSRKKLIIPSESSLAAGVSQQNAKDTATKEENQDSISFNKKQRKLIRRISKKLDKLGNKIRELEEVEVDLSDDESSYIQLQRYREKFCLIYKKLCEYRKEVCDANRVYCRRICFTGSKYPAINKCIENWLNKTRKFPDFSDIMKLLESQSSALGLPSNRDFIRSLATEIFQQVGVLLQRRRKYDLWDSFCGFLNDTQDPADKDADLERILKDNYATRVREENKILQYYAEMQEKQKLVPEEVPEEVASNSETESGSEDEKEVEAQEENEETMESAVGDAESDQDDANKETGSDENSEEMENISDEEAESHEVDKKESKNNYKNCKSLKWRRENGPKISSEELNAEQETERESKNDLEDNDESLVDDLEENSKENSSSTELEADPEQKKRVAEDEISCTSKRMRSNVFEIGAQKENLMEVFDVHYCRIEEDLGRFDFWQDLSEMKSDWKNGKVFRDLTNVKRLMALHGGRPTSGWLSPSYFHRGLRDFEKRSWKKRFKFSYKLVTSKGEKLASNQGKKTGKAANGNGRDSAERGIRNNSKREGVEGSSYFSGQGSGGEGDNNRNDGNRKNGRTVEEENAVDDEKDEEGEDEETQSVEHSEDRPQKTEQLLQKNKEIRVCLVKLDAEIEGVKPSPTEDGSCVAVGGAEKKENKLAEPCEKKAGSTLKQRVGNDGKTLKTLARVENQGSADEKEIITPKEKADEEEPEILALFVDERQESSKNKNYSRKRAATFGGECYGQRKLKSPPLSISTVSKSSDVEFLEAKIRKRKTTAEDEERVKRFLQHSPSSISITPPRKLDVPKPPSQAALKALATLRGLKGISATIVRSPRSQSDVVVIEDSSKKPHDHPEAARCSRSELPVISSVQSITPKILTVEGNVSGFENEWSEESLLETGHSSQDPNPVSSNSCSSIRISNVWGNFPSNFIHSTLSSEANNPGCSFRQTSPRSNSAVNQKGTKKKVEYVVLD